MKRLLFTFLTAVAMCMAMPSCGSGGTDEPDSPDEPTKEDTVKITRPQDGDGKVFLESGRMVDANTDFTTADLKAALAATSWTCSYIFYYDNDSISDILTDTSHYYLLAHLLTTDHRAFVGSTDIWSYSARGKTIIITPPVWSNTRTNTVYTVVAVDYTDTLKRLIIDHSEDQFEHSIRYRMVWVPQEISDAE